MTVFSHRMRGGIYARDSIWQIGCGLNDSIFPSVSRAGRHGWQPYFFESRYLSVQVGPEQAQTDLLQNIVEIRVPETITTVGESLDYLLRPYGCQIDEFPEVDEQYLLLILALQEPHRRLGPMTLMDAITTLGGNSFRPLINSVKRTVKY